MGRPRKTPLPEVEPKTISRASVVQLFPIIVDRDTTATLVGLSPSNIDIQVKAKTFPAPRLISKNRVGWRLADLQEWAQNLPVSDILPPAKGDSGQATTG